MNTAELIEEPGTPDFHRRFLQRLKTLLNRPAVALVVGAPADLPKAPEAGSLAWVRSISRLAVFDGGWKRTDTGAAI